MDKKDMKGSCLCGSVTIHASAMGPEAEACHCSMCRRWTSGPFLGVKCEGDVRIDGQEHVGVYPSSEWAERGFCRTCGSTLFYRLKESGAMEFSAGLFQKSDFRFVREIFIDKKPAYYSFANDTHKLTGAEVFAAFEKAQEGQGH